MDDTRILVIMPSRTVQGMERANFQIMKMMRERGVQIRFVTDGQWGAVVEREAERIGCSWVSASFEKRLHLTKSPHEMSAILRAWAKTAREIGRIYKQYRPTHVYVTNLDYFMCAFPVLCRTPQPVVFRLPNPPNAKLPPLKQKLSDWIWRYCVGAACDVIVCNSRYTMGQLLQAGVPAEKTRLIYNCVPERFSLGPSDAPRLSAGRFNIAFVGQIRPCKGVIELFEVALRIVQEREEVDFVFAGDHEWQNPFAKGLIEAVKARNLEARIRFTGWLEDVFGLLSQCDLHVCPSISAAESFPNAILEAKREGLPSVVFPTSGIPEAVTHLVDGYICRERSAEALYEGIQYFLNDPVALKTAGEAARQSLKPFSREQIADQWASIFKNDP